MDKNIHHITRNLIYMKKVINNCLQTREKNMVSF